MPPLPKVLMRWLYVWGWRSENPTRGWFGKTGWRMILLTFNSCNNSYPVPGSCLIMNQFGCVNRAVALFFSLLSTNKLPERQTGEDVVISQG